MGVSKIAISVCYHDIHCPCPHTCFLFHFIRMSERSSSVMTGVTLTWSFLLVGRIRCAALSQVITSLSRAHLAHVRIAALTLLVQSGLNNHLRASMVHVSVALTSSARPTQMGNQARSPLKDSPYTFHQRLLITRRHIASMPCHARCLLTALARP